MSYVRCIAYKSKNHIKNIACVLILGSNAFAAGLTTIGSGRGADEAADCGRVLHVGDGKLYLRSVKKTTPSLNVSINDTTFYGNMTEGASKGSLRINSGGKTYSVHDDSM